MDPLSALAEASEVAGLPSSTSTALGGTAQGRADASNSGDFIVGGGAGAAVTNWVLIGAAAMVAIVFMRR